MKLLYVSLLLLIKPVVPDGNRRPNVLLIMVDDLRPKLGCYGHTNIRTPNIDQLAAQSVQFNNAFVQQALCAPSRTSMLTSRRPDTTRLYDFYSYWRRTVGNYTTLPQYFKHNGYRTVSVGKIFHHGVASGHHDDYPYSWSQPPYRPSTMYWRRKPVCPGIDGKTYENLLCAIDVKTQPEQTLPDIQNADYALKFLRNHSKSHPEKPFFLGVGFYKPHVPFKFPREYLDLYPLSSVDPPTDPVKPVSLPSVAWNPWTDIRERHDIQAYKISFPYGPVPYTLQQEIRQHYYASTTYMDYHVGRVLSALDQYRLTNNTIIAFIGDHGWALGEHQEWSKYSVYDEATRVPFLISTPDKPRRFPLHDVLKTMKFDATLKSKTEFSAVDKLDPSVQSNTFSFSQEEFAEKQSSPVTTDALVEAVDLFPTLVDLAGLKSIPPCSQDTMHTILCTEGYTLKPLLDKIRNGTEVEWKNATFSQYPRPGVLPAENSDKPRLKEIKIMGYSMHTLKYRYTEWVGFSHQDFKIHWNDVKGRELYDLARDENQDENVAGKEAYSHVVEKLSRDLRVGWRGALPPKNSTGLK